MKRGIVIGKFYPPHLGHSFLIDAGLLQSDELTVLVCHHPEQRIPGERRAEWLREMHPKAVVRVIDDIVHENDSRGWAEYTKRILGRAPDVVFTSEDYGERYAGFLGCRHVLVDRDRKSVPVSSSEIRGNPLGFWEYLPPCVRAHYALRVCVVGAESTGTTTLARALAEHYRTCWVPEFGRMFWEAKMHSNDSSWTTRDFAFIAAEQNRIEDELARRCNRFLVCDTDSFATMLWEERYMGMISPEVAAISEGRRYGIYFLTDVDVPFIQDGTRDGEYVRSEMHRRFEEELVRNGKRYLLLSGNHESRLKEAVKVCDELIENWR